MGDLSMKAVATVIINENNTRLGNGSLEADDSANLLKASQISLYDNTD